MRTMDICVVTYRNDAGRVAAALREGDRLYVHDNTVNNVGFAAGANATARQGDGDIVVFVNPDGDPAPGCFAALEAALADPHVVAVEATQGAEQDQPALDPTGRMAWLSGACMAVRREAFERAGGFDERFFMYCEDVDLSYRLAAMGELRRCTQARFHHDPRRRSLRAQFWFQRNWLVVQRRHHRARPLQMLRDAAWNVRCGLFREASARVAGVVDYLLRARRWA
jgi:GT2 family glycosyltransferase